MFRAEPPLILNKGDRPDLIYEVRSLVSNNKCLVSIDVSKQIIEGIFIRYGIDIKTPDLLRIYFNKTASIAVSFQTPRLNDVSILFFLNSINKLEVLVSVYEDLNLDIDFRNYLVDVLALASAGLATILGLEVSYLIISNKFVLVDNQYTNHAIAFEFINKHYTVH